AGVSRLTRYETPPVGLPPLVSNVPSSTASSNGGDSCAMVNILPPAVIVALRATGRSFSATAKLTVPLPCPELVNKMLTNGSLDVADQAQSEVVMTLKLPV